MLKKSCIKKQYHFLCEIGKGAYSRVYKAVPQTKKQKYDLKDIVAIKQINHNKPGIISILKSQINWLKKLKHPNIIKLFEIYHNYDQGKTYLIMQYMPFDLITYYKQYKRRYNCRLPEQHIKNIFYQMCSAINYLHGSKKLLHRDIKPQNIMISPISDHNNQYLVKLIDFGFVTTNANDRQYTPYMITRWYRPLEICLGLNYDQKADIFSLGAVLLQLYLGQEIFKSASNFQQIQLIYKLCGYPNWGPAIHRLNQLGIKLNPFHKPQIFQILTSANIQQKHTIQLISSMLQIVPSLRSSIEQILTSKYFKKFEINYQHPFVNNKKQQQNKYYQNAYKRINKQRINSFILTSPQDSNLSVHRKKHAKSQNKQYIYQNICQQANYQKKNNMISSMSNQIYKKMQNDYDYDGKVENHYFKSTHNQNQIKQININPSLSSIKTKCKQYAHKQYSDTDKIVTIIPNISINIMECKGIYHNKRRKTMNYDIKENNRYDENYNRKQNMLKKRYSTDHLQNNMYRNVGRNTDRYMYRSGDRNIGRRDTYKNMEKIVYKNEQIKLRNNKYNGNQYQQINQKQPEYQRSYSYFNNRQNTFNKKQNENYPRKRPIFYERNSRQIKYIPLTRINKTKKIAQKTNTNHQNSEYFYEQPQKIKQPSLIIHPSHIIQPSYMIQSSSQLSTKHSKLHKKYRSIQQSEKQRKKKKKTKK